MDVRPAVVGWLAVVCVAGPRHVCGRRGGLPSPRRGGVPPPPDGDDWLRLPGAEVLLPPGGARPRAVLHFIGGAFVGAAPSSAYGNLLSRLSRRGMAVVATPVVPSLAHGALADATDAAFADAWATLTPRWGGWIPVFGVGHSLGAKLTAMATASPSSRVARVGNVLMSFNNPPPPRPRRLGWAPPPAGQGTRASLTPRHARQTRPSRRGTPLRERWWSSFRTTASTRARRSPRR